MMIARQTVFELAGAPAYDRASFLTSNSNLAAIEWIDKWPVWPTHALSLSGPAASGKTHLGQIWRMRAKAETITPGRLTTDFLTDITSQPRAIVLEDADVIAGDAALEQGLFHLYNLLKETRQFLLLISQVPPTRWIVKLPDLASRLGAIPIARIEQPDDALLTMLLAKLFSDRQLNLPPDVLSYLLARMERSFIAAERIASDLDTLSLSHKRPLTVALARMALEEQA